MEFFRSLKKRKINPASPQQEQTYSAPPSSDECTEEPTGGFFYNLFFGSSSNNNNSKLSKKRANDDEEQYNDNENAEYDQENQVNCRSLHRSTQPKKRIHSKYPEIKKHRDEIQKMKNSIQSLTDKTLEGASSAHLNMSMLTNTTLTPKKISDESIEDHSKGYPRTPHTPSSAKKKKSLLSSLFSFNSAANADSPPPLPSTPNASSIPQVSNSMINVKITELKQDDLQRIKNSYRSPLYTRTPPRREMQNHVTNLDEMLEKRKSIGFGNQQMISHINNPELSNAGNRNSFDSVGENTAMIQTRKSQGGYFQSSLTREASSSSGFSNLSDSSNSFNTMSSVSQTTMQSFQYLSQPTIPFVFNLNLLKGGSIKNSGNGFKEHSNVYAVIEIGNYRKTSKVIMNSSNPVWNQQFQFILPTFYHPFAKDSNDLHDTNTEPINNVVTIRLYDHDEIFEHEFLGKVELKLDDLYVQCCRDTGKIHEKTRELLMKRSKTYKQLMNLQGVDCGTLEIQFRIEYHPRKDEIPSLPQNGDVNNGGREKVVYCFF